MTRSITRTLPIVFAWQAVTVILGFVTQVLLARYMGPEGKGVVDLFLLLPSVLASVGDAGLLAANTYFAGKSLSPLNKLHSNSLVWSVCVGLLFSAGSVVVVLFVGSPLSSLTREWFVVAVFLVIPSLYFSLWSALMYGSEQSALAYKMNALGTVFSLLLYGSALLFQVGISEILAASAAVLIMKALAARVAIRNLVKHEITLDRQVLKQSLLYGSALYIGIALNILHFRIVQFVVESMLGSAALGYFALAVRIAELVWLLDFVLINTSIFKITASSLNDSIRITQRMTRVITFMIALAVLVIMVSAPIFVPLFFGEQFEPTVRLLTLLLPGVLAWSAARSLSQFIAYQKGTPWVNTTFAGITLGINIALMMLLIPPWGVEGAALSSTLSYLSMLALTTNHFVRVSHARLVLTFIPQREDFILLKQTVREQLSKLSNP